MYNLADKTQCVGRVTHPMDGAMQALGWVPCASDYKVTVRLNSQGNPAIQGNSAGVYVGCYGDSLFLKPGESRNLPKQPRGASGSLPFYYGPPNTYDTSAWYSCRTWAMNNNYALFAVQYGTQCWGGYDLGLATREGTVTTCTTCPGGICGMYNTNAIYALKPITSNYPPPLPNQAFGGPFGAQQGFMTNAINPLVVRSPRYLHEVLNENPN